MAYNYLVDMSFNGKNTIKTMVNRVIRRIRFDTQLLEAISKFKIASLDSFTRLAVYEKIERDFKVKLK